MMSITLSRLVTLLAALCVAVAPADGAEGWRLEEVTVAPAGAEAWERAWRAAAGELGPAATLVDEASRYVVLSRAGDLAAPAGATAGGEATVNAVGPEDMRSWLLHPEPALSRPGSGPPASGPLFVHYRLLFVEAEHAAAATETLGDLATLLDRHQSPLAHRVYRAIAGPDRPLLVIVSAAESAAEWYARRAERDAALGEEGRALERRLRHALRRIEPRQGRLEPRLSYGAGQDRLWAQFAGLDAPVRAETGLAVPAEPLPQRSEPSAAGTGSPIVAAARAWIERAPSYDPAYRELDFPGGDPGPGVGTGVDLIVRALRGIGLDLQEAIYQDLGAAPEAYGEVLGNRDTNIDHRRLRNLIVWLERHADSLGIEVDADWQPGDLVVWDTVGDGQADHVGILSDRLTAASQPFVIHHFPARAPFTGTPREESVFDLWPRLAHFRVHSPETGLPSP